MLIDRTLYEGRPEDCAGRTAKEIRCYELLDSLGIPYFRVDHDHADTIEACGDVEKILGCEICKNLFLTNRQQTDFYLLLTPGRKPFKTRVLSREIGTARLSFGSPEHMAQFLDITPGSVSVLGLMNDRESRVRLLIDRDLTHSEYLCCHPCINTSTLKLKTADVLERLLPALGRSPEYVDLPWEIED
ncbi:MAG TPA: prolyl-tRNA synthetase associated domain-containing protein [Oscillospiraceae bacterium]|nr:prolyl-tRNA synthetase associated domain-containing protein [Oscillospiraceae bacterium]